MLAKKTTIGDLPVFKSYSEFHFQEFKKRKKLLFYWSCIHWGALTIQNIFQLVLCIQTDSSYLIEILIFIFYLVTWLAFNVFLRCSAKSYKWYNFYEYAILFGTVLLSPLGLWYAGSQSTPGNTFQYYVEVSLSIQCFFFLTQRAAQRTICYACYVVSTMVFMLLYFETYGVEVIIRKIVFSIAVSCSFGVINSAFEAGSKDMLKGLQEFWKSSFEIIPHGVIMLDDSLNIKFTNTGFGNIFNQNTGFEDDKEQMNDFSERLATLPVLIRQDIPFVQFFVNQVATDQREIETPTLLFNDFLKLEDSRRSQPATICGDCKINNKSIEVKALRTTFKGSGDYYVAIFVDTTERDKLANLQDQNGFKDSLLKSVSHELRGPLNASMVSITKVLESTTVSIENKKTLEIALVCQLRLLKSIDGILDLAKANSRQIQIKSEEVDVQKSIQRTARLFEYLIEQKKINFNIKITQNSNLFIHSDPERIEQILYQLLDNAVKFTHPHGSVTLEANTISTGMNSSSVEFTLRDTGCGLSAEEVQKANALLCKGVASEKVSKNSAGIGLGFMIVATLLSRIGSDCKMTSEPRKGTIFYFRLKNLRKTTLPESDRQKKISDTNISGPNSPVGNHKEVELSIDTSKRYLIQDKEDEVTDELIHARPEKISISDIPKDIVSRNLFNRSTRSTKIQKERHRVDPVELRSKTWGAITTNLGIERSHCHVSKILVVDDDAFNLFALESRLRQIGYVVLTAYNGKDALEILKEMHPSISLILMDLNMPVMDGYETTKLLKQMMAKGEMWSIPIIACTAYAQEIEQSRCLGDIGFDDFAIKPLDSEKLGMILKKFNVN